MSWGSQLKKIRVNNAIDLLTSGLLDLFLPPRCPVCRQPVSSSDRFGICAPCQEGLPLLTSPICTVCGIPLEGAGPDHPCGTCINTPPPYTAARAALRYERACRDLIQHFKYNHKTHLRRPLGLIMAEQLAAFATEQQPDMLIPVPLHRSRLRSRGFNQAVLIGELLAERWHIPLLRDGLIRIRHTLPQVELSRDQRQCNLNGAFAVRHPACITSKRIMLVDDVYTTGSTLAECAAILLKSGCNRVTAVTVAHAR